MKPLTSTFRITVTAILLALGAQTIAADDGIFPISNTSLQLSAGDEFCQMNPVHAFDKAWLEWQGKANANNNELLGAMTLCDDLETLRTGETETLNRWVILLAPTQGKATASPIPGLTRDILISELEKVFKKGVNIDIDEATDRVNKALPGEAGTENPITISSLNQPEVLGATEKAIFLGIAMQVAAGDTSQQVVGVFGMTLVKQHMVSVYSFGQNETPDSINKLLAHTHTMIDDLVAKN